MDGVEEFCTGGLAACWVGFVEERTDVLNEARIDERISSCSVDGWRLGTVSRFSLEGCLLERG